MVIKMRHAFVLVQFLRFMSKNFCTCTNRHITENNVHTFKAPSLTQSGGTSFLISKMMEFAKSSSNLRTFCRAISSGFKAGNIGPINVNGVFEGFPFLFAVEVACFSGSALAFTAVVEVFALKNGFIITIVFGNNETNQFLLSSKKKYPSLSQKRNIF
jgi:hypothetical protein